MVHLPLINVLFPSNVMIVVSEIISVATFDIPDGNIYVLSKPIFGELLAPPFDDKILGDYPDSAVNFRS